MQSYSNKPESVLVTNSNSIQIQRHCQNFVFIVALYFISARETINRCMVRKTRDQKNMYICTFPIQAYIFIYCRMSSRPRPSMAGRLAAYIQSADNRPLRWQWWTLRFQQKISRVLAACIDAYQLGLCLVMLMLFVEGSGPVRHCRRSGLGLWLTGPDPSTNNSKTKAWLTRINAR